MEQNHIKQRFLALHKYEMGSALRGHETPEALFAEYDRLQALRLWHGDRPKPSGILDHIPK